MKSFAASMRLPGALIMCLALIFGGIGMSGSAHVPNAHAGHGAMHVTDHGGKHAMASHRTEARSMHHQHKRDRGDCEFGDQRIACHTSACCAVDSSASPTSSQVLVLEDVAALLSPAVVLALAQVSPPERPPRLS